MKTYNDILSFKNKFCKDLYDDSIRQRNNINSKFTPMITILIAEVSAIIWLMDEFINYIQDNKFKLWFLIIISILCITIISIIKTIVYFIKCFRKFDFYFIKPNKMKEFLIENEKAISEYDEEKIYNNILENISDDYIDAAIKNIRSINNRSNFLGDCYDGIIITLLFMFVDFIIILILL